MSALSGHIDPPNCREDLVRKAANSPFIPYFHWINDNEALRVTQDAQNQGLPAVKIRELA